VRTVLIFDVFLALEIKLAVTRNNVVIHNRIRIYAYLPDIDRFSPAGDVPNFFQQYKDN
jgi:hypothetical protein